VWLKSGADKGWLCERLNVQELLRLRNNRGPRATIDRHFSPSACTAGSSTPTDACVCSRRATRPSWCWKRPSSKVRAQGMPGARCTRSPCALVVSTRSSPQVHRKSPGIPCAMVLTAYGALSPATNSSCHRRPTDGWRAEPGWADLASAGLSISNGCQDHTLSPYAATSPIASTSHVLPAEVLAEPLKHRSSAR
jgi:hypothetical protein